MSLPRKTAPKPMLPPRLSAPLTAVRRQFLNAVKSLTAEDAIATLRRGLAQETSELARLGNLAAQSWIVRQRLIALQQQTGTLARPVAVAAGQAAPLAEAAPAPEAAAAKPAREEPAVAEELALPPEGWRKLRITNETEVNGMIFFAGSAIQVQAEDALRLIASGHAEEYVELAEQGKPKKRKAKPKPRAQENG